MCDHCGCSIVADHEHDHGGGNDHSHHHHTHPKDEQREVEVRRSIFSRNDRLAERNRGIFMARRISSVNLMSSPGSGKTSLIERTLDEAGNRYRMGIIVGDLATDNDARRIRDKGAPAIQVSTGTACHLDAHMVHHALEKLNLDDLELLFIENVGNLVCPASFDLGEEARVVIMAVTEGEDKPLKYPVIFHGAAAVIVNKMDLAESVGYDRDQALENIKKVAPGARIMEVSARTGDGMADWYDWLGRLSFKTGRIDKGSVRTY